jgi:hypothetical protein
MGIGVSSIVQPLDGATRDRVPAWQTRIILCPPLIRGFA